VAEAAAAAAAGGMAIGPVAAPRVGAVAGATAEAAAAAAAIGLVAPPRVGAVAGAVAEAAAAAAAGSTATGTVGDPTVGFWRGGGCAAVGTAAGTSTVMSTARLDGDDVIAEIACAARGLGVDGQPSDNGPSSLAAANGAAGRRVIRLLSRRRAGCVGGEDPEIDGAAGDGMCCVSSMGASGNEPTGVDAGPEPSAPSRAVIAEIASDPTGGTSTVMSTARLEGHDDEIVDNAGPTTRLGVDGEPWDSRPSSPGAAGKHRDAWPPSWGPAGSVETEDPRDGACRVSRSSGNERSDITGKPRPTTSSRAVIVDIASDSTTLRRCPRACGKTTSLHKVPCGTLSSLLGFKSPTRSHVGLRCIRRMNASSTLEVSGCVIVESGSDRRSHSLTDGDGALRPANWADAAPCDKGGAGSAVAPSARRCRDRVGVAHSLICVGGGVAARKPAEPGAAALPAMGVGEPWTAIAHSWTSRARGPSIGCMAVAGGTVDGI